METQRRLQRQKDKQKLEWLLSALIAARLTRCSELGLKEQGCPNLLPQDASCEAIDDAIDALKRTIQRT